ncbi:MAG: Na+/H+ antiporter subunit E, partial [Candidatus Cloacimonadaceae bacterium]|nr:Na+/H+ antiporter subunit E [Candidatus Cloacimonadaceae bacterium]
AFFGFCAAFSISLLSSNLDVASRVVNPRLPIAPGILEIKTALTADLAIMLISYAITLTPGTIMIETREDSLFIHAINVDSARAVAAIKKTISTYEKYLSRMFY